MHRLAALPARAHLRPELRARKGRARCPSTASAVSSVRLKFHCRHSSTARSSSGAASWRPTSTRSSNIVTSVRAARTRAPAVAFATSSCPPRGWVIVSFPLPPAKAPDFHRDAAPGTTEEVYAASLVGELEALIEREGPDTISAFIAEPVMGTGGVLVPPRTYFDRVQAVLRKHDILLSRRGNPRVRAARAPLRLPRVRHRTRSDDGRQGGSRAATSRSRA
jgi:hypothetical protein